MEAKIYQGGSRSWPEVGEHVACDGAAYRIVELGNDIQTTGSRGNWIHGRVTAVDWSELDDEPEWSAAVVL